VIPSGLPENLQAPVEKATTQKTKHKKDNQSCPQFEDTFKQYGLLPVDRFSYIMWRESRCQEKIVSKPNRNGTRDYGLLQINSSWSSVTKKLCKTTSITALTNHKCNLTVAKYLFDNGGLNHWSATSGSL
jgi:hypothetical protein